MLVFVARSPDIHPAIPPATYYHPRLDLLHGLCHDDVPSHSLQGVVFRWASTLGCWVIDPRTCSSSPSPSSSSSSSLLLLPLSPCSTPARRSPLVGNTANTRTSSFVPTTPHMTDLIQHPAGPVDTQRQAIGSRYPARSLSPPSAFPRSNTTSPVNVTGDLHRVRSLSPKSIQVQSLPLGAVPDSTSPPPTSSSGTYYSASKRYSNSTRNSVWTTRSSATVSTQYSVDNVPPPVPESTQGLGAVNDLCQCSPTSKVTL